MLLSNQNSCDDLEIKRIPKKILKETSKLLSVEITNIVNSFDKPRVDITSDHNYKKIICRAWHSKKYDILLCHRCSGYYGWFIWIGNKRLLWSEKNNEFVKEPRNECKIHYI